MEAISAMDMISIINFLVNVVAFIILSILLMESLCSADLKEQINKWYFLLLICIFFGLVVDILIGLLCLDPIKHASIIYILDPLNYIFWGIQCLCVAKYIHQYISKRVTISETYLYLVYTFCALNIIISIIAAFNHWYFIVDVNGYRKQDLLWVSSVFPLSMIFTIMIMIVKNIKSLMKREWLTILFYLTLPVINIVIMIIHEELWLGYFFGAISIFLFYINIQINIKHELKIRNAELTEKRIEMLLSQIQPHFLYNSLTSIRALCEESPKAQDAIISFSKYLRSNMDTLFESKLIPFEKEIQHVQNYLKLEILRFEERLNIVYDITVDNFMIPTLTVQPIVENAVRYGVTKKKEGGTITIRTREKDNSICIIIEDDGVGFDTKKILNDGRSHIGINNVRERLVSMCNGNLDIESIPQKGTIATIEIPK